MPIDIEGLKADPDFRKLSPDQRNAILQRALSEAGAPVASSTVGTQLGKFGQAATESIVGPVGGIVGRLRGDPLGSERAVAGFRSAVGAPTEPSLGGSGSEPVDPTKSFGGKVGQVVGETAPFIAGGIGAVKAATAIKAALGIVQEVGAPALLTALAKNSTGRTIAREARVATQAGVGAAVAQEADPGNKVAEVAGMLLGAFGPEGARKLINKIAGMVPGLRPVTREAAQARIGGMLQESIPEGSAAEAGLNRAVQTQQETGLAAPVAQATGAPGVRAVEREATSRYPSIAAQAQEGQASASEAVRGRLAAVPEAQGSVPVAQEAVGRGLATQAAEAQAPVGAAEAGVRDAHAKFAQTATDVESKMQAVVQQAERKADEVATAIRPTVGPQELGEQIQRDVIAPAKATIKREADRMYALVDPENAVTLPTDQIADAIKQAKIEQEQALVESIPALDRLLAQVESQPAAPFNTVRRWASALGDASDEALRGAEPNRRVSRLLAQVGESVQGTLDEVVRTGPADVADRYQAAKSFFSEYADKFLTGAVNKVLQRGVSGEETKVAAEDVGKQFFRAGTANESVRSIQQYFNAVGADPAARQAIRDTGLNDFFQRAYRNADGSMDPKAAMGWMREHRAQLDELASAGVDLRPELTKAIQQRQSVEGLREIAARAQKRLDAGYLPEGGNPVAMAQQHLGLADAAAKRTVAEIERSAASKFVGADPDQAGKALLTGLSPAKDVQAVMSAAAGDPAAQRGIRRALLDQAMKEAKGSVALATGQPLFDAQGFGSFLDRHAGALRAAFGDEGLANLRREHEIAAQLINPQTASTSMAGLGPPESVYTTQMLLGRAYQGAKGFASWTYLIGEGAARSIARVLNQFSNDELRQVYEQALFNPTVARDLRAMSMRGTPPEESIRRLRAHLGPTANALTPQSASPSVAAPAGLP